MPTKKEQALRALGLCDKCAGPLDQPGKFIRCESCRKAWRRENKMYRDMAAARANAETISPNHAWARKKAQMEAQQAIAAEKRKQKIKKCMTCEWARIEDSLIFCPFMEGICVKGDYSRGKQKPDQGQRPADPV